MLLDTDEQAGIMTSNEEIKTQVPTTAATSNTQAPGRHAQFSTVAAEDAKSPPSRKLRPKPYDRPQGSGPSSHAPDHRFPQLKSEPRKYTTKSKKPPWDPFARYYSGTSALPDYGHATSTRDLKPGPSFDPSLSASSNEMGKTRLKAINAVSAPINTLSSARKTPRSYHANDFAPPRRQKHEGASAHTDYTRSLFPPSTQAPRDDVEDSAWDLPQDDPYDIGSTTSSGDPRSSITTRDIAPATLSEFRGAQPKQVQGQGRLRRSRLTASQQLSMGSPKKSTSKTPRRNIHTSTSDSPDVLAIDETPPANIVSDIAPESRKMKRAVSPVSDASRKPQIKRTKTQKAKEPINLSEDELSFDNRGQQEHETETTDFLGLGLGRRQRSSRADIQRTTFKSPTQKTSTEKVSNNVAQTKPVSGRPTPATTVDLNGEESSHQGTGDDMKVPPTPAGQLPVKQPEDTTKRETLKDKMIKKHAETARQPLDSGGETKQHEVRRGPNTRRTTRSYATSEHNEPIADLWTDQNPGWKDRWHNSLVFPPTGRNRATVDLDDITRLNEGEFLNDNLVSFYLRYLQTKLEKEQPEVFKRVYVFSTFFFEKLRSTKGQINYEGVRNWTAKVDLLSYDYIVVPVNENAHWYLVIICNVPAAVRLSTEEDDDVVPSQSSPKGLPTKTSAKSNLTKPFIMTLDSLGPPRMSACAALKSYLVEEAKNKKGIDLNVRPTGVAVKGVPQQDNFCDCGVFVLGYMEEFMRNPDETVNTVLEKKRLPWDIKPSELRSKVRGLLFELQDEQQDRLVAAKSKKRAQKEAKADFGLKGGTATGGNSSSEAYYSAPSSPPSRNTERSSKLVVELAARPRSFSDDQLAGDGEPEFVQALPSSSPEQQGSEEAIAAPNTVPFANAKGPGTIVPWSKRETRSSSGTYDAASGYFPTMKSIERDKSTKSRAGPQYDGIDRSANIRRRRS